MCYDREECGRVAQWIEQQIPVLWVGGSNPSALVTLSGLTHGLRIFVIATQGSNLKVLFSGNECVSPIIFKNQLPEDKLPNVISPAVPILTPILRSPTIPTPLLT
jgi:hypothetical protein